MPLGDVFSGWLRAATSDSARASVLSSLRPLLILTFGGAVANGVLGGPAWLTTGLFVCAVASMLVTLGGFGYFAKTDPAALRSERFGIKKMEIDRGWFGDNTHGLTNSIEAAFTKEPEGVGGKGDE